ncbi:MAG: SGNH/GDSL hydrolase family protein [Pseudomonadales bacterium]
MKTFTLTLIASFISLLCLEGAARWLLDPSQFYSSFHTIPAYNQWRNEVEFWERYGNGRPEAADPNFDTFDDRLGWDAERTGDRIRGSKVVEPGVVAGSFRLLAIGDSFVYGTDVEAEENFCAVLGQRVPSIEVLNMGVPGYGIDQAYLKYLYYGAEYRPDAVVFGIYVSDYERASMNFTWFAKPRIVATTQGFSLENQPVPAPEVELERIERTLAGRIRLVDIARNTWRKLSAGDKQRLEFFESMDAVVSHILQSLKDKLQPDQQLLLVHIPRAESFVERDPFRDEMSQRLLAIYQELELTHIDLGTAFLANATPAEVFQSHYVHRPSGSVGHLSPLGHEKVAILIQSALELH